MLTTFQIIVLCVIGASAGAIVVIMQRKISAFINNFTNNRKRIDLFVIYQVASAAQGVAISKDNQGHKVLIFTYNSNSYAIYDNGSIAIEISEGRWIKLSRIDGDSLIEGMKPRPPKQDKQNTDNNQSKQNDNHNKGNNNNKDNGNKQSNVIPNDVAERWFKEGRTWDTHPNKQFNKPYFLCQSDVPDETEGLWIVGKRQKGN